MSEFRVGDEVLVEDASDATGILFGKIYTVSKVDGDFIQLQGISSKWFFENRFTPAADPALPIPPLADTEEHTGGSSSYYTVKVESPTTKWKLPYEAECNDIIEALNMTFAEANTFKATWRTAAARQGKKKKGNNAVYDAEKCVFFSGRMLVKAKKEADV